VDGCEIVKSGTVLVVVHFPIESWDSSEQLQTDASDGSSVAVEAASARGSPLQRPVHTGHSGHLSTVVVM